MKSSSTCRELRFQEGTSDKFWTINVAGKSFTVQFGRTGTAGRTQTKTFKSETEAKNACAKLVADKLRKGYQEVGKSKAERPRPAKPTTEKAAKVTQSKVVKGRVRRFELRDAKKPQWCNLALDAATLTCFSGAVGSGAPRRRVGEKNAKKTFSTVEEAAAAFDKKFQEVVAKGYIELCSLTSPSRRRVKNPLDSAWQRIEAWMCHNAPAACEFPLAAPAKAEDIQRVEELLGLRLPKEFRDSYCRHNGSNRVSIFGILGLGYWTPLFEPEQNRGLFNSVTAEWEGMSRMLRNGLFEDPGFVSKPKGPIKKDHWNPKWIPFTCDDCGDFLCIDMDPPSNGKKGQVIFWWHEVGAVTVVSDSFESLICRLADKLDAGVYAFGDSEELRPTRSRGRTFDELLKLFQR